MDTARIAALELKVARLERQVAFLLGFAPHPYVEPSTPAELAEVMAFIKEGNKLAAIKAFIQVTGKSLTEAKDTVEAYELELRKPGR